MTTCWDCGCRIPDDALRCNPCAIEAQRARNSGDCTRCGGTHGVEYRPDSSPRCHCWHNAMEARHDRWSKAAGSKAG